MYMKLKTLLQQLLQSPVRFPVEAVLGLVFFVIAVRHNNFSFTDDVLWLFVPLLVLSFVLHRVNR